LSSLITFAYFAIISGEGTNATKPLLSAKEIVALCGMDSSEGNLTGVANDGVIFIGSNVTGGVIFIGSNVTGGVIFIGSNVTGGVIFIGGGRVIFIGSNVTGAANGGVIFIGSNGMGVATNGRVIFIGSNVTGRVIFFSGNLTGAADGGVIFIGGNGTDAACALFCIGLGVWCDDTGDKRAVPVPHESSPARRSDLAK